MAADHDPATTRTTEEQRVFDAEAREAASFFQSGRPVGSVVESGKRPFHVTLRGLAGCFWQPATDELAQKAKPQCDRDVVERAGELIEYVILAEKEIRP